MDHSLDILYNNLLSGKVYGYYLQNTTEPLFTIVLDYYKPTNLLYYSYYGSSCMQPTKENLQWILSTIFELSAAEFIKRYIVQ